MNAIAVAACDQTGRPFLALSLAAIREWMSKARIAELLQILRGEADCLEGIVAAAASASEG